MKTLSKQSGELTKLLVFECGEAIAVMAAWWQCRLRLICQTYKNVLNIIIAINGGQEAFYFVQLLR